jgi:hypothetical protein
MKSIEMFLYHFLQLLLDPEILEIRLTLYFQLIPEDLGLH